jgi:hypothetical protein
MPKKPRKRRQPKYNLLVPLSPVQQRAQATQTVNAALAPQLQDIARQEAEVRRVSLEGQNRARGLSEALAQIQREQAPQVGAAYNAAAGAQAGFAKGFSDQYGAQQAQDSNAAAEFLRNIVGAPSQQIDQIAQVGRSQPDVLYQLGGYIPSTQLTREGAAAEANARAQPNLTLGRGQQQIGQAERDLVNQLRELGGKSDAVTAQAPGLRLQVGQQLFENELKKRATGTNEQIASAQLGMDVEKLGMDRAEEAFDQQATLERLKQGQQRVVQGGQNLKLRALQNDRNWQAKLDSLGISKGHLRVRAAELQLRRKKKGSGGYSTSELRDMRETAGQSARDAFNGIWKIEDGERVQVLAPQNYQRVIRDLLAMDIPIDIAQRALNYYYKPGQRGRPLQSFQQRQRQARRKRKGEKQRG